MDTISNKSYYTKVLKGVFNLNKMGNWLRAQRCIIDSIEKVEDKSSNESFVFSWLESPPEPENGVYKLLG
jgi:hypothetical protein